MNYGFPFGYGMMNPREQVIGQLKEIRSCAEKRENAQQKVARLKNELEAIEKDSKSYPMINTEGERIQKELTDGKQSGLLLDELRRAKIVCRVIRIVMILLALSFHILSSIYYCSVIDDDSGVAYVMYAVGALGTVLLMWTIMWSLRSKLYKDCDKKPSENVGFYRGILCVAGGMGTFLSAILAYGMIFIQKKGLYLLPILVELCILCAGFIIMHFVEKNRLFFAKSSIEGWKLRKQEELKQANAKYEEQKREYIAKQRAQFAPRIDAKDREIREAVVAMNNDALYTCAAHQVYPFLKERGSDYISRLISLIEGGRADTVKEAMNILADAADRQFERDMERIERMARQRDEDAARERLEAEARRARIAEEDRAKAAQKAAEELERIRRLNESKK